MMPATKSNVVAFQGPPSLSQPGPPPWEPRPERWRDPNDEGRGPMTHGVVLGLFAVSLALWSGIILALIGLFR